MNLQHVFGIAIKQEKVNLHRFFGIAVVLLLVIVAILTARLGIATSNVVSSGRDLSDYALRHPELLNPGNAVDLSDYYARHPGATIVLGTAGASDWFQRHPESLNAGNAVDLTDYYARHPGKEQDDLVTTGPSDRQFPGKEQDDLVTARP
jgi:hypothetical protein